MLSASLNSRHHTMKGFVSVVWRTGRTESGKENSEPEKDEHCTIGKKGGLLLLGLIADKRAQITGLDGPVKEGGPTEQA